MKTLIKRIIEMDNEAREITDAARREKIEAEHEIEEKANALRTEYLERARRRAQINAENERTINRQKWQRTQAQYQKQEDRLQALFEQNGDALVEALVARVLNGENS